MGYIYDDQNIFDSGFILYLKRNIVKSTRHLNVYRFPKTVSFNDLLKKILIFSLITSETIDYRIVYSVTDD